MDWDADRTRVSRAEGGASALLVLARLAGSRDLRRRGWLQHLRAQREDCVEPLEGRVIVQLGHPLIHHLRWILLEQLRLARTVRAMWLGDLREGVVHVPSSLPVLAAGSVRVEVLRLIFLRTPFRFITDAVSPWGTHSICPISQGCGEALAPGLHELDDFS